MLDKFDCSVHTDENLSFWVNRYMISGYVMDMKGRATLQILCNFMWETAGNHGYAIHTKTVKDGIGSFYKKGEFWLLSRFYIKIYQYPSWNDVLYIRTWVKGSDKLFALRDFQLIGGDGNIIGEATSAWLLVDIASRRPRRLNNHIGSGFILPDTHAVNRRLNKIQPLTKPVASPFFQVRYSDLDLNNHVNNIKYINWILNDYPYKILSEYEIDDFEINYIAESFYGDEICIASELLPESQLIFIHNATRKSDGHEVLRVKIKWRKNIKEYRRKESTRNGI